MQKGAREMLQITVVQPPYYMGENPDEKIADFLLKQLETVSPGALIVLPEYSNAGGLSDAESELKALPRAQVMLNNASCIAKTKGAYVLINVLEERNGMLKNSSYLFDKGGNVAFIYDKQHLPPSEVALGVTQGNETGTCKCICDLDGIRFAFMTCYDVYFNEQIEFIAQHKPDIIVIPGYQRGERTDIIRAQAKLTSFRCNAYIARASYSMNNEERGGCSMIVAPDGQILQDIGNGVGTITADIDPHWKYMRPAGFGGNTIRNDDFIASGLCPDAFKI